MCSEVWAYTSKVKAAVAWPRRLCTDLISAPLAMAIVAAVCLRSCGLKSGLPIEATVFLN